MSAPNVDAFPGETEVDYDVRMTLLVSSWQCTERESGGYQCERPMCHDGGCACPEALRAWYEHRYGKREPTHAVLVRS